MLNKSQLFKSLPFPDGEAEVQGGMEPVQDRRAGKR